MKPTSNSQHELFMETIRQRRSIRKYKPYKIPIEHIRIIEEAARRAPTDAALHLWTAIHVRDDNKKKIIAEATRQPHIAQASDFYLYIADLHRLQRLLQHRGEQLGDSHQALLLFAAIDAGIAAENMVLAAVSLGYGTCFIGAVHNATEQLIKLLKLPILTYPLFGLVIGYPDEAPPPRPRLPPTMLFHREEYQEYTSKQLEEAYKTMAPITRRGDYLRLLKRYVAAGGYFEQRNKQLPELLETMGFKILKRWERC
ncbi:MAG: nitroreductase family protein [Desulfurococcales archaeon]|nr:nitroreductase family protein [Desulfurococcales archaeon]